MLRVAENALHFGTVLGHVLVGKLKRKRFTQLQVAAARNGHVSVLVRDVVRKRLIIAPELAE